MWRERGGGGGGRDVCEREGGGEKGRQRETETEWPLAMVAG